MSTKSATPAGLTARLAAVRRLAEVMGGAAFQPFGLAEIADARDRALANRLVTLALRRHGHIDRVIAALMPRGLPKRSGLFTPLLRLALAELLYGAADSDHAAVYIAGEIAKSDRDAAHLQRLLNGVLRNAQRRRAEFGGLPPDQLFPDWLARRWRQSYGAEALIGFAKGLIGGAALDLSLKPNLTDNALVPEGEDILLGTRRLAARDRRVVDLVGYGAGAWWVQDVAASLPARLIGVKAGAHVLDLCAAPGGKTAQLAAAGYKVTAVDADKGRLETLKANLDRLRLTAEIVCEDARGFGEGRVFDAVLIDAPCSATGTFRRHPEVIWQRQEADLAARAKLQAEIVENALGRLPRGGILVYSTCSLEAEEGEAVAAAFADGGRGLKAMPVAADEIGGFGAAVTGQGFVRTHPAMALPSGARGMDGFFAARLVRA